MIIIILILILTKFNIASAQESPRPFVGWLEDIICSTWTDEEAFQLVDLFFFPVCFQVRSVRRVPVQIWHRPVDDKMHRHISAAESGVWV